MNKLLFLVLLFALSACKKESDFEADPMVEHLEFNRSINLSEAFRQYDPTKMEGDPNIDIDKDGNAEFIIQFRVGQETYYDNFVIQIYSSNPTDNILLCDQGNQFTLSSFQGYFTWPSSVKEGTNISQLIYNSFFPSYMLGYERRSVVNPESNTSRNSTISGKGFEIIPFNFYKGGNMHSGWLRLSLTDDLRTIVLMDAAYHKEAFTDIKAGHF